VQPHKILFIHNAIATYRSRFFKLLDEEFKIEFIFTYLAASDIIYGQNHHKVLSELKLKDARTCKGYFSKRLGFLPEGIPFGLLSHLLTDNFDVIVDSPQSFKILLSLAGSILRRKPLILWTLQWYDFSETPVGKLQSFILTTALKRSAAILVPGLKQRDFVHQFCINPHKVFVMPNVSIIDSDELVLKRASEFKDAYGIGNKKIILYVGRLVERKGVKYLMEAFSALRHDRNDVDLVVVGDGPLRSRLQALANRLSISDSVIFLGPVDRAELPTYYSASDVCVVPSITHTKKEPWGLVLNEAMQFGKPVIATTAVGAAYDLIKDGENGFLIPERDEKALYEKMKLLVGDEKLRNQMGAESRRIVDSHYQYTDMVEGFRAALAYTMRHRKAREREQ
jgi:glycosyltransferase involved in cell wall biosynthesis